MATDWSLDFCLVCDRQTLGAPYCSQSCRLAELDLSSEASLSASRNAYAEPKHTLRPRPQSAVDHTTRNPDRLSISSSAPYGPRDPARLLSPSSSQTSLSSMKSHTSQASTLDQFQNELRDYANCFDPVRDLKRRLTS
ncbi:hypothetical protein BDV59DRAFT_133086 [Aspergillus ambiguus]|uniref:uncharacterized protein n=1 Tax=Aspergillus ambiguus TaxID=176160 RepID=UPI003CCD58B5